MFIWRRYFQINGDGLKECATRPRVGTPHTLFIRLQYFSLVKINQLTYVAGAIVMYLMLNPECQSSNEERQYNIVHLVTKYILYIINIFLYINIYILIINILSLFRGTVQSPNTGMCWETWKIPNIQRFPVFRG